MDKLSVFAFVTLAVASASALAHGDEAHAGRRRYDAGKVEETAFGREGDPGKVSRTIRIVMSDSMRFTPDRVTVERGQTVKFVVRNGGRALHEMVLGTPRALQQHAELMKRFPDMEHADPNMAHVAPGESGEIVWQFTRAGEFRFACLQPGHYEAGMIGKVVVK